MTRRDVVHDDHIGGIAPIGTPLFPHDLRRDRGNTALHLLDQEITSDTIGQSPSTGLFDRRFAEQTLEATPLLVG